MDSNPVWYPEDEYSSANAIASQLVRPAQYAVSIKHLVVPCPYCPRADGVANTDPAARAQFDFVFAVLESVQSANLHCDAHKLQYHQVQPPQFLCCDFLSIRLAEE